jgi:hypothetical protein
MFFIFFGMFASVGLSLHFSFGGDRGCPSCVLQLLQEALWFIRPQLAQPERLIDPPTDIPEKPSLLTKHWKRNLAAASGAGQGAR